MRTFLTGLTVVAALGLGACSSTTGVDIEVRGADKLAADQIVVTGVTQSELPDDGGPYDVRTHSVTAPEAPRTLGATEDLRIVVDDGLAGKRMDVTVKLLKAGTAVATGPGAGIIVAGSTKRIRVCFDATGPVGCPATP